jgi:hypothetical protein
MRTFFFYKLPRPIRPTARKMARQARQVARPDVAMLLVTCTCTYGTVRGVQSHHQLINIIVDNASAQAFKTQAESNKFTPQTGSLILSLNMIVKSRWLECAELSGRLERLKASRPQA